MVCNMWYVGRCDGVCCVDSMVYAVCACVVVCLCTTDGMSIVYVCCEHEICVMYSVHVECVYACIVGGWRYVFYVECAIFSMCMYGTHVVYLLCICVVHGMYSV